jgi:hypothetical protein
MKTARVAIRVQYHYHKVFVNVMYQNISSLVDKDVDNYIPIPLFPTPIPLYP